MFKFFIHFLLLKITIAQIHLTKYNLNSVCNWNSSQSNSIYLSYKDIASIDSSAFNGLNSLQRLYLQANKLEIIDSFILKRTQCTPRIIVIQ